MENKNLPKPEKDISDYFSPVNTAIIILNVLIFLYVDLTHSSLNSEWMLQCGAMYVPNILEKHEYYRIITSMFLHFGIWHLAGNMLVLWFIGGTLEPLIGKIKYFIVYLLSGILAGIISISYNVVTGDFPISAGASGAIFGVTGALLFVVLIHKGHIEGLTKKQMFLFVFLSLFSGVSDQGIDNMAHFGGFFIGLLLAALLYRKPKK
ncbi:rhomboid family intramembrane serine protease [Lachnospiraceae bacterium WCA-693-APC-MOT-I]|uniref:Rhomboid family intramembrane serine protease n=2 Tax=Velocimicrobium porci TaxID=2606634 RepID=A0A6L5XWK8_9FIRM|nr:rhomboid family intramembrane serine protease [Velocimicrobium porci]